MATKPETEPTVQPIAWDGVDREVIRHNKNQLALLNRLSKEAVKSEAWLYTDDFFRLLTDGVYDYGRLKQLRLLTRGFPTNVDGVRYAVTERSRVNDLPRLLGVGHTEYPTSPGDWNFHRYFELPPVLGRIEHNSFEDKFIGRLCLTSLDYTAIINPLEPVTMKVNGIEHPIIATVSRPTYSLGSINREDSFQPASTQVHFGVDTALTEVDISDPELIERNLQYVHSILDVFKGAPTFGGGD